MNNLKIVGSLTTMSSRIDNLHKVIESLYIQSHKLDNLYLFISKEKYLLDEGIKEIPSNLKKYIDNGFLIVEFVENTGAYRKFLPIIKKFNKNDNIIITYFDDDWIFPPMLVEKMYETYQNFPNCFISMNTHRMFYDNIGELILKKGKTFKDKSFYDPNNPRLDLWNNNSNGVMFKATLIQDNELFNYKKIKSICHIKDEIWLNAILKKNKIKIVGVDNKFQKKGERAPLGTKWGLKGRYKLIEGSQEKSLAKTLKFSRDDYNLRIEKLRHYYKL
tara:strand:+ start:1809 stop:2633 length:825 start_codon:yes stop_codon:yes gene_type:complete